MREPVNSGQTGAVSPIGKLDGAGVTADNADNDLPIDDMSAVGSRESVRVAARWLEPPFIFREEPPPDLGADAHVELRRQFKDQMRGTGRRAYIQVKHTIAPARLSDGSISYPISTRNLRYLGSLPCSFYLLYVQPTGELLFCWHRDVLEQLQRTHPGWHEQSTVQVRFSRSADDSLLNEIAVEIDSVAEQGLQLAAGPGFVRSANAKVVRDLLMPDLVFVGRSSDRARLRERIKRGALVHIVGEADIGKSELVRQELCDAAALDSIARTLGGPIALLHVDLANRVEPRLLRGIAWALGRKKDWDSESDDAVRREQAVLLAEDLPARTQGQRLLVFLDSVDVCIENSAERAHLQDLLSAQPLRAGALVMAGRWEMATNAAGSRPVVQEIRLGPLAQDEATELVRHLGIPHEVAAKAMNEAIELPELLAPGTLRRAVELSLSRANTGMLAGGNKFLDDLLSSRGDVVRSVLASANCDGVRNGDGTMGQLLPLLSLAVLGECAVVTEDLRTNGQDVPQATLDKLVQVGWLDYLEVGHVRLKRAGSRALRLELIELASSTVRNEDINAVAVALRRLIAGLAARNCEASTDTLSGILESSIAWVRSEGLDDTKLGSVLLEAFLPLVVDDVFFPISAEGAARAREQLLAIRSHSGLNGAVAETVLALRVDSDAVRFLTSLESAIVAAVASDRLSGIHIRALDISAHLGRSQFRLNRKLLPLRVRLLQRLAALGEGESRDLGLLKWATSWAINTAHLAAMLGDVEHSHTTAVIARKMLSRLPAPRSEFDTCGQLWLRIRLARVNGRIERDPEVRRQSYAETVELAFQGLAIASDRMQWATTAMRAVGALSQEVASDEARDELLATTEARLVEHFGQWSDWPLSLKAIVAAAARDAASCGADPHLQLGLALRYVDRMAADIPESTSLARLGDARPLLVLARCFALVSVLAAAVGDIDGASTNRRSALDLARESVNEAPSAAGWELYLRMLDQDEHARREVAWRKNPDGRRDLRVGDALRDGMVKARRWLYDVSEWNPSESNLALWCLEREWKSQGSLEIFAAKTVDSTLDWDRLSATKKRTHLEKVHLARLSELDKLERRAGTFQGLFVARVRAEGQFQRLLAIYGNHVADGTRVLAHLNAAAQIWPDSFGVANVEAQYFRYVWDYANAIPAYRRLVAIAPRASDRREATIGLVELLLAAAMHCDHVLLEEGTNLSHDELIREAHALLSNDVYFRHVAKDAALVRELVALETGATVDWDVIELAFYAVVGDVDAFATTVVANADALGRQLGHLPQNISELLMTQFGDEEVLRCVGTLFLRRGELRAGSSPIEDCRKAYACFTACRVLEKAWSSSHSESATTSYQRGRALLLATVLSRSRLPFKLNLEGKLDCAHLSISLFSRAVSLSVGRFHQEAKRRQGEAQRVCDSL